MKFGTIFVATINLAVLTNNTNAFSVERTQNNVRSRPHTVCDAISRRNFFSVGTATTVAFTANVFPAIADVSDGNSLPDGAVQFSRLLKAQKNLEDVTKRVSENPGDIDKKEWDNLSDFIRVLYKSGEDMKVVAKGIYDPEKKKKSEDLIKYFQKLAQSGDEPVSKQDTTAFLAVCKKSSRVFEEFFDLLRDVPDEI